MFRESQCSTVPTLCMILNVVSGFLQNKESLSVLVVGKGGVGKSSTVNSIVGERVTVVSAFQVTTCTLDEFFFFEVTSRVSCGSF